MFPSKIIEKLKIGKRFVLLVLEVAPDRAGEQQLWDSAGPENKNVPLDVWQAIYRKLGELCRKQFGEGGGLRRESVRAIVDKEYLYRVEERPFFVVRYEFKDENFRDNLNIIFNENGKKLHPGCLVVRIKDESREGFQEMQEQRLKIEKMQKENEALLALSASQEYTPAPVKASSSSTSHSEYVPTALNGTSPENSGRYKPSRIEDTVKCVPDPYTPSSSQEDSNSVAYVPATVKTPRKKKDSPVDVKPIVVSSSSESRKPVVSKRRRQAEIFGNSDDEEEEESDLPSRFTPVAKRNSRETAKSNGNMSDDNLFSEESPAKELIGSSSDEVPTNGRSMRDRKPKNNIDYNLDITSPESKDNASSSQTSKKAAAAGKRRRKETAKSKMNESLDGWLQKDTKKPTIKKEATGESSKPAKEKKATKKEVPAIRQPVDREALKKENEAVRQQIAALDKIDLLLPEDKTLLNVPYLTTGALTVDEMVATYDEYERELLDIHETYRDKTERQWMGEENLCYFTDVTLALTEDQKWAMMKKLERELVPKEESGKYTEFFTSVLVMEWGLRVWMKLYGFTDRRMALDRIKLQEEANPMEMTQP
uniref:(northern house mosquito) hypothetical protein n=1 Tax=Culex pipiens TaxID=7175 RepID=A0A8D8DMD1_CULPI